MFHSFFASTLNEMLSQRIWFALMVSIAFCLSLKFLNVAAEKIRVLSTETISTCLHYSDFKDSRVCVSF